MTEDEQERVLDSLMNALHKLSPEQRDLFFSEAKAIIATQSEEDNWDKQEYDEWQEDLKDDSD